MARKALLSKDKTRGKRFTLLCQELFPGKNKTELAALLGGVSLGTIRNWEQGQGISRDILERMEELGASLAYLLHGDGEPLRKNTSIQIEENGSDVLGLLDKGAKDSRNVALTIGANLKAIRKQRFPGWGGQRKFAEYLNLSANDLSVYEYGRSVPNEHRLEEIAAKLELTPDELRKPLPGVTVDSSQPEDGAATGILDLSENINRERIEELKRTLARLEGKLEAMQEHNRAQDERIRELQEANFVLRNLLFFDDQPETLAKRKKLLEKLSPTLAELIGRDGVF